MKKTEFISKFQKNLEDKTGEKCNKLFVSDVIDAFCDTVKDALCNQEDVCFRNFMTFKTSYKPKYTKYNGIVGKNIDMGDSYKVKAKVSLALNKEVDDYIKNKQSVETAI